MRVLRISHSAVVDSWRERERALRRRGVVVHTLTARRWDEAGAEVPLRPRPGEPVTGVATVGRHPALFLYSPVALWRALGRGWDLLDIHEEPYALATAEVLLLRALRCRRTPYALYSAQNIRKRYRAPFRWWERWALRGAAGLSVCNAAAGRICADKGLPGRPTVIPLGVDTRVFRPARVEPGTRSGGAGPDLVPAGGEAATSAGRPGPALERVVVGYAGRLAVNKGVAVALAAVAGDPRLHLRIAGAGPQEGELRAVAARLGAADRVEVLGPLPDAELPGFYRSLDVLAVPSLPTPGWQEQFGRVAVEAMACGTPVVASATGALPEVVGDAGVLVPPGEARVLRAALLRVGLDGAEAARLRARGLARAAECDWEAVAARYHAMYGAMLHQGEGPQAGRALEVVLVAYGRPELVRRALAPLRGLPLTVVDNGSQPEVAALAAELGARYLDPGRNLGFAAAVNRALAHRLAPGGDVLLLNPDAVIAAPDVHRLQAALLAERDLASVGPAQLDEGGVPARVAWPFPSVAGTWLEALGLGRLRGRLRRRGGFVIGAVLLLRAEALAQVGGLDEAFFLYGEETDWAYRAARLGWRHAVVDSVTAVHAGAASSADEELRQARFHAAQERFLRKHAVAAGWQAARAGQLLGSAARALLLRGERAAAARARHRLYREGPLQAAAALEAATLEAAAATQSVTAARAVAGTEAGGARREAGE